MEDMNRQALPKDPETELAESLPVPQPDKDKDKDKEVKENEDIEETAPAEPAKGKEGKKRKRKKGNKKAVKEGGDEVRPIKQSQKKAAVPLDVVNDGKSVVGDIPKWLMKHGWKKVTLPLEIVEDGQSIVGDIEGEAELSRRGWAMKDT